MLTAFDWVGCPTCDGDGYLGNPEYGHARNCSRCNGRGKVQVSDLSDDEQDGLHIEQEEECEE